MPTPTDDDMLTRTAMAEIFRLETLTKRIKERVKADPAYAEVVLVELRYARKHIMSLARFNDTTTEEGE